MKQKVDPLPTDNKFYQVNFLSFQSNPNLRIKLIVFAMWAEKATSSKFFKSSHYLNSYIYISIITRL